MRKAFVIVPSGVEVDPSGDRDISRITKHIVSRTIVVMTRQCIGEGVFIAGKIVTSTVLVRNEQLVSIILPHRRRAQAVVARRDEINHIAELKQVSLLSGDQSIVVAAGRCPINTRQIGHVGSPLLIADSASGKPVVSVAGMSYHINVCERREEDSWAMLPNLPRGLSGGGIWNIDGEFVGMSLASRKPYFDRERSRILALRAEDVMNFAESS
ncbi:MAG: hypothetical protein KBC33_00435 [Candidatus Pacebacteria bacterium]|nr:hypothetical protein [Candidatus Paceibacterota bacterium]